MELLNNGEISRGSSNMKASTSNLSNGFLSLCSMATTGESKGEKSTVKIVDIKDGYVLQDVPHFLDYIPNAKTYRNPLQDNPAYAVVKQYFVDSDDTVAQKVVVHKDSPRGIHFRRAGPSQRVYFESDDVHACIVTCGGLCPGLNTVIRELVCGLCHMYGVKRVVGIDASQSWLQIYNQKLANC